MCYHTAVFCKWELTADGDNRKRDSLNYISLLEKKIYIECLLVNMLALLFTSKGHLLPAVQPSATYLSSLTIFTRQFLSD